MLQLTIQQEQAVDLLISGKHDREVADALGVHRVTVTRWRLYHPEFQAALNDRRASLTRAASDAYRSLVRDAIVALRDEMTVPGPTRAKAALEILRLTRINEESTGVGPTSAKAIVSWRLDQVRQDARDKKRRAEIGFDERAVEAEHEAVLQDLLAKANEPAPDAAVAEAAPIV